MQRQQQIEYPAAPERPNNWYACDLTRALIQATESGELDSRTAWLLTVIINDEHQLRYRAWPRYHERQFATRCGLARTTMRDCRQRAIAAGWLTIRPTPSRGVEYRVEIPPAYLSHTAQPAGDSPERAAPAMVGQTDSSRPDRSASGRDAVGRQTDFRPRPVGNQPENRPSYIPSQDPISHPSSPNPGWSAVAEMLVSIGLRRVDVAIARAVEHGITPIQVEDWIGYYRDPSREGDYQPGVLYARMTDPDARRYLTDEGWPPPNPAGAQRRAVIAERERIQADARRRAAEADDAARRRERTRQLELQYGEEVDRMTPAEQVELLGRDSVYVAAITTGRGPRTIVRQALLEAMAARYGSN